MCIYPFKIHDHSIPPVWTGAVTIDDSKINVKSYYDGFRISWEEQNFADSQAISYHLQVAKGREADYIMLYRGSSTKYTWKADLENDVTYRSVRDVVRLCGCPCLGDMFGYAPSNQCF